MKRSIISTLMIWFSSMPGYDLCRRISDVEFDMTDICISKGEKAMDTVMGNVLQKPNMKRNMTGGIIT